MKLSNLIAALVMTGASSVFAQSAAAPPVLPPSPSAQQRIDQREANQQKRIEQGNASGELTNREAARLEKGQARIHKMEDKANADGKITRKGAAHIDHAQNQESRKIAREKHDRQHDRNHDGKMDRPAKK